MVVAVNIDRFSDPECKPGEVEPATTEELVFLLRDLGGGDDAVRLLTLAYGLGPEDSTGPLTELIESLSEIQLRVVAYLLTMNSILLRNEVKELRRLGGTA